MNPFTLFKEYAHWFLHTHYKGHGVHSPFIFDFVAHVLHQSQKHDALQLLEKMREKLLRNDRVIEVWDYGAGSRKSGKTPENTKEGALDFVSKSTKVKTIAKHSLSNPKYLSLLFRLTRYYQPKRVLELGTSLGLSAMAMSLGAPNASIDTLEGAPAIAKIAQGNFDLHNLQNIKLHIGSFKTNLPEVLKNTSYNMVFIDGDHKKENFVHYFDEIVKHVSRDCVIILDDIRWSESMQQAWQYACNHHKSRACIDLFFWGIIFVNPHLSKQIINLRF